MKRLASFAAYEATMASVASVAWTRPTAWWWVHHEHHGPRRTHPASRLHAAARHAVLACRSIRTRRSLARTELPLWSAPGAAPEQIVRSEHAPHPALMCRSAEA